MEGKAFQAELDKMGATQKEAVMQVTTSWEETGIERGQRSLILRLLNRRVGSLSAFTTQRSLWGIAPFLTIANRIFKHNFYISGNLTVYYSPEQTKKRDFRGPDVFIVLNAEKRDRHSWAIWEEGDRFPNVVIELLSESTATVDRTTKKALYQDVWQLPEYYWFDPDSLEFAGFRLKEGRYEPIAPNAAGHLSSVELGLALGLQGQTLRWFTAEGELVPFPEEVERQATERERQAKERLEAFLRSQGIDPNNLPQ
jgi:hypothetical protein